MGITISTLNYPEEVRSKLLNLNSVIVNENKSENYTLFEIDMIKANLSYKFKRSLAEVLAEIVIDNFETELVNNIIKQEYNQFSGKARSKIEQFTMEYLKNRDKIISKIEINTQLLKYLESYKDLNIEGFVRFRLKDYVNHLKYIVDRAVDDYLIEEEYNEFIELLRYFVNLQEPKIKYVDVLKADDDSFNILDPGKRIITSEYMEDYIAEIMDGEVEYEDLLISALINIAPGKIIIHFDDKEVEETIKDIFGGKVQICDGCSLCKKEQ